jgi:DnaK suppressor protein
LTGINIVVMAQEIRSVSGWPHQQHWHESLPEIDACQWLAKPRVPEFIEDYPSACANQRDDTMDIATQTHLTTLRDLVTYRLLELRAEVHAAEQAQRQQVAAGADEVSQRKDEAAQQQFSDLNDSQAQRDIDEMAQVEAALHRLDSGTYGDCADCGEPISLQRLLMQPAAQRCAPCQAADEHAPGRSQLRRAS